LCNFVQIASFPVHGKNSVRKVGVANDQWDERSRTRDFIHGKRNRFSPSPKRSGMLWGPPCQWAHPANQPTMPMSPPIHWLQGAISPRVKRPRHETNRLPLLRTCIETCVSTLSFHYTSPSHTQGPL